MKRAEVKLHPENRSLQAKKRGMVCSICNTPILPGQRYYRCTIDAGEYQTPELERGCTMVHLSCVEEQMLKGNATLTKAALEWMAAGKKAKQIVDGLDKEKVKRIKEDAARKGILNTRGNPPLDGTKGGTICLRLSIPEIGLCP